MLQLRPGESFPITRKLGDPTDTGTYYVRAVLTWADDESIVQVDGANFVNLADKGSNRFRANVQVPVDKRGGLGSYLLITTTVYTDSGYTQVSDAYRIEDTQYLVFDRRNPYQMGGGGADVNYKRIKEIFEEVAKTIQPVVNIPKFPDMPSLKPVVASLEKLDKRVQDIKIPEPQPINLEPIISTLAVVQVSIKTVIDLVKAIKIPEQEKVEFEPVLAKFDEMAKLIESVYPDPENVKALDEVMGRIKEFFTTDMDQLKKMIGKIPVFAVKRT